MSYLTPLSYKFFHHFMCFHLLIFFFCSRQEFSISRYQRLLSVVSEYFYDYETLQLLKHLFETYICGLKTVPSQYVFLNTLKFELICTSLHLNLLSHKTRILYFLASIVTESFCSAHLIDFEAKPGHCRLITRCWL